MSANTDHKTQVLIAGGGPVGLTLAIELGRRGVRCVLVEKQDRPRKLPKMERCNARTMEFYRRLGLADKIRQASAPAHARMDSLVAISMAEPALVRLSYPSFAEAREATAACNDGTLPLEPQQLVSQYTLEPLLKEATEGYPSVAVWAGCELVSFEQDTDGVTTKLAYTDGRVATIRSAFLVGTDGGRSTVRKQLGIALQGDGRLARKNQVFFHSDNLFDVCPFPQGRMYFFTNQDQSVLSVQDSLRHFVFHTSCWGDYDELRSMIRKTIALPIDFEILATTGWNLHLLVAERYMERRVFLAGDSVHLVIPTGGLGLNTGIGDAVDLAWKLAGTLAGWGGRHLLPSYDIERRAIGVRNKQGSEYAARGQIAWRSLVRPNIAEDTPEGRGVKAAVARIASVEQRKTHEQYGTELGYRYESSPLICSEPDEWTPDVREVYIPSARPGARLPHAWLADGSALHDRIGDGYTLLRLRQGADEVSALAHAIRALGAPLEVLDIDDAPLRALYERDLLLLRPDLHVCWRGNRSPAEPEIVAATVTGHYPNHAWVDAAGTQSVEAPAPMPATMNW